MNNAMKFTPEYGKITITAENKPSENSVTISISDTGIGIAEDQIKKLFFTDSTETTAGTSGELGTGLGLLLCKDLIQRNGGTFWVKSSLGQGTSFFFTVPISSTK
jgi:signal transduction histidine kinase